MFTTRISQNHWTAEVGKDLLRSSGQTPQPKEGQPEQVSQDRWVLDISKDEDSTTSFTIHSLNITGPSGMLACWLHKMFSSPVLCAVKVLKPLLFPPTLPLVPRERLFGTDGSQVGARPPHVHQGLGTERGMGGMGNSLPQDKKIYKSRHKLCLSSLFYCMEKTCRP